MIIILFLKQQIPTTGNAGTNSGAYGTKPSSYGSGYGAGASYDTLTNAGPTGQEYKNTGSAYTGTQTGKTGTCTGNSNSGASSAADIGANMYAKSHVALSKVNVCVCHLLFIFHYYIPIYNLINIIIFYSLMISKHFTQQLHHHLI